MIDVVDDSLVAVVCHQLGEGVSMLRAYTAMVREAGAGPPAAVSGLEEVTRRLSYLDDALLDLARLSRAPVVSAPISSSSALSAACRLLANDHPAVRVEVQREPLPRVMGDPEHVQCLFVYALRQAAKSGRRRLSLVASRQEDLVVFAIGDDRVVAERPASGREPPRGDIGIELGWRIARSHGGDLWLDKNGDSVTVALPGATS